MARLFHAAPLAACPERQTLADFLAGRLAGDTEEVVGTHVAECPRCEVVLSELSDVNDDALGGQIAACLQIAGPATTEARAYRKLEERAKAFSVGGTISGERVDFVVEEPADPSPQLDIGPYLTLGRGRHGGMGVVYKARHRYVNRVVALKTIWTGRPASPELLARFQTEGVAVARLDHPNIVRMHDYGEHNGLPYFTMDWIDGGTLAARLDKERPDGGRVGLRQAVAWVRAAAEAIHYAHERDVLHRDLKPGNILLTTDGVAKVADFGLAKLLDAEGEGITLTEQVFGTPSYMAAEQATGRTRDIGPHTDVYALGAILYETFTREPPYLGKTKAETLQLVIAGALAPPSKLAPDLPADLEAVCLKCLEPDPSKRYKSANALAAELGRWLSGEPTLARPLGRVGRAVRAVKKRGRVTAVVAGLILLGGAVGGAVAAWYPRGPQHDHASRADDREWRLIEPELVRGNPVTLIGATGRPKWYRWQNRTGRGFVEVGPDGTFTATHPGVGLLELLPDSVMSRYKLTAQVRHDRTSPTAGRNAGVGLFAGHAVFPGSDGDIHLFSQLVFNGVWGPGATTSDPSRLGSVRTNEIRLGPRSLVGEGDPKWDDSNEMVSAFGIQPLGEQSGEWYTIDLRVGPSGITGFVTSTGGSGAGENRIVLDFPARNLDAAIAKRAEALKKIVALSHRPEFVPRAGFGLVVDRSTVAVRNVVVTTLQPDP